MVVFILVVVVVLASEMLLTITFILLFLIQIPCVIFVPSVIGLLAVDAAYKNEELN
jgi:hypothetical protein